MITFRQVVAQALADALAEGDAKAMATALPHALRRRFAQAGYAVVRTVAADENGKPLTADLHAQHHPQPVPKCVACEVFAVREFSDAP